MHDDARRAECEIIGLILSLLRAFITSWKALSTNRRMDGTER